MLTVYKSMARMLSAPSNTISIFQMVWQVKKYKKAGALGLTFGASGGIFPGLRALLQQN